MNAETWVTARANCTLSDNLTVIMNRVKADVRSFNSLPSHKRGKRRFNVALANGEFVIQRMVEIERRGQQHIVEDTDHISDVVIVRCTETAIYACRKGHLHLEIVPCLNVDTQSCDLLIDGKVWPVWQVSEKIIGDFIFSENTDNGLANGARS